MKYITRSLFLESIRCTKLFEYLYFSGDDERVNTQEKPEILIEREECMRYSKMLYPKGKSAIQKKTNNPPCPEESTEKPDRPGYKQKHKVATTENKPIVAERLHLEAVKRTETLMALETPVIYGACFAAGDALAEIDILYRDDAGWAAVVQAYEAEVSEKLLQGMAFQYQVLMDCRVNLSQFYGLTINTGYVRKGGIVPEELFIKHDVTALILEKLDGVKGHLNALQNILQTRKHPDAATGRKCFYPTVCPHLSACGISAPESSVYTLYQGGELEAEMQSRKITAIKDIPADICLSSRQKIQKYCDRTGEVFKDRDRIDQYLDNWKEPLFFPRFESIKPLIPVVDGTRPLQEIPITFSVFESLSAERRGFYYFAPDMTPEPDFRLGMVYAMKSRLGYEGSIVVYNSPEVRMMLEAMADAFPAQSDYIYSILERMVDLCIPFKNFWYYTPAMKGSAAFEAVLPALLPHYTHNADELPEATYRHLLHTLAVHRYALLEEADLNAMAAQAKRYLLGGVGLYEKLVE